MVISLFTPDNTVKPDQVKVCPATVVAAGSVVIEEQQVGPYHLVAGVPAKVKNRFEKKFAEDLPQSVKNYLKIAATHMGLYQHHKP